MGGAAPLPPIGGGTDPLPAARACKHQETKEASMRFPGNTGKCPSTSSIEKHIVR